MTNDCCVLPNRLLHPDIALEGRTTGGTPTTRAYTGSSGSREECRASAITAENLLQDLGHAHGVHFTPVVVPALCRLLQVATRHLAAADR